jgi:hypothetical protein
MDEGIQQYIYQAGVKGPFTTIKSPLGNNYQQKTIIQTSHPF